MVVGFGADVATTSGAINITGSGVTGGSGNYGVRVEDDGSTITSTSGNITLTGSGSTTGAANYGIGITNANALAMGSMVSSGSGNLKIVSKAGDVFLSGASTGTGVIASPIGGSTIISSQRNIIVDSVLSFNTSPVTLRVDNTGIGAGALSFTGNGQITAGTVNLYYNPTTFGTQDATPAQISATTLNRWMLVNNATNLKAIGTAVNLGGNYALGNNLDMTGFVGFTPIGSNTTPFTGQFDGLNREISNLTINTPAVSQVGLFGVIGATGAVKNLGLTNVVIRGDASVGALAGINYGNIYNTYVSGGTVTGSNGATGGLVGVNQGGNGTNAVGVTAGVAGSTATISNSYVENVAVEVMAALNPAVGGLVGFNRGGAGGAGGDGAAAQTGGVGGAGGAGNILNSYVLGGHVYGMGTNAAQHVGGLVGQNIGGNGGVGGAGVFMSSAGGNAGAGGVASISSSYSSSGVVSGGGVRGGLIGNNQSGTVGAAGTGAYGGAAGGLGVASADVVAWDSITTGQSAAVGAGNLATNLTNTSVNVLTTWKRYDQTGYVGFDFTNTWWIGAGSTRPMLRTEWNTDINNAHQLQLIANNTTANYSLNRDLDLTANFPVVASPSSMWSSRGFYSVGTVANPFKGSFDGNGHIITGLNVVGISTQDGIGMFSYAGAQARISNVTLVNSVVTGEGTYIGSLVGRNAGLIFNTHVQNTSLQVQPEITIPGVGGLAGLNSGVIFGSDVTGSLVEVAFGGVGSMGGLVGVNQGSVINSFVSGTVPAPMTITGSGRVGGLIGRNDSAAGLVVGNKVLGAVTVTSNSDFVGGLVGELSSGMLDSNIVDGVDISAPLVGNVGGLIGFVGASSSSTFGRSSVNNSYITNGTISGSFDTAPIVGFNSLGAMFSENNTHYNIETVTVNGAPMVVSGGLYGTQFNEWLNAGTLNIANYNGVGQSLAQTGNINFVDTALGSMQGMKDLIGFADDPRYNFRMSGNVDITPLVNYSIPTLAGTFDGNGVLFQGTNIFTPTVIGVGLFGHVLAGAEVSNLHLSGAAVEGNWNVGALVGWNEGVIRNSSMSGAAVSAVSTIGGLVGVNDGFIEASYVSGGSVSATSANGSIFGGMVGINNGSIKSSYVQNITINAGTNSSSVGGMVGNNAGSLDTVNVNGLVMSNMALAVDVGGLVGTNGAGASIVNSHVAGTANVIGLENVGGLVGSNIRGVSRGMTRIGIVDNNYFSGTSVTGQSYVGGLVGRDGYMVGDGYYVGVTNNYVSSGAVNGSTFTGPLVGNGLPNMFTNNRYNVDTVSVNTKAVVLTGGLYTTQFTDWVNNGKTLNIANYSGAGGSLQLSNGKYTITSVQGLKDLLGFADSAANVLNANYSFALGNGITLPVGVNNYSIPVFTGSFDGQGNTISGVNIDMAAYDDVGFIQKLGAGASINNLGLIAPVVVGNANVGGLVGVSGWSVQTGLCSGSCATPPSTIFNSYVSGGTVTAGVGGFHIGGLVGFNNGDISGSSASGAITVGNGGYYVGGLTGYNMFTGSIVNSTSSSTVTAGDGSYYIGGLAGYNDNIIDGGIASGAVNVVNTTFASYNIGGLVGYNGATVTNSQASGAVSVSGGSSNNAIGGLVGGMSMFGTVIGSRATGGINVSGDWSNGIGGLVGNASGAISSSYATGNITAGPNMNNIGGLAGRSSTSVSNSFATGSINVGSAGSAIGGLVGNAGGTITSSYATGGVVAGLGVANVGGLVGSNTATISETYATGAVSGTTNVGGLVGQNFIGGVVGNSYWNSDTAVGATFGVGLDSALATGTDAGASPLTNVTLKNMSSFAGWSIANTGGAGMTWRIYEGNTGPLLTNFLTQATVTANDATVIYNGVGYIGGNGLTAGVAAVWGGALLGGTYGGTSQGAVNVQAGGYTITATSVYSDQLGYDIIGYTDGVLTIDPKVVALNGTKVYDGTATFTGGTNLSVLTGVGTETLVLSGTADTFGKNVGNTDLVNTGTLSLADGTNGGLASNYTLVGAGLTGVVSISKANATVTANSGTGTYTGLAQSVTGFTATGLVNGELSSVLTGVTAGGTGINAGTYLTTASGTDGNYNLTFVNGTLVISPAIVAVSPLTVTANDASKTYGTTLNFAGTEFTPVGLLNGDTITGVMLTSAGAVNTANAGSYSINVTPGSEVFGQGLASNYTLTYASGTLTVNPASLTVSAIVQTKIYGDADPSLTYTSSGLLFSDVLTGSLGRIGGQNVGNYAINQGSLSNPNYAITFTGNTLSITPRDITVAATAASKVYGDADPNQFTVGGSGLASWDTNTTAFTGSLSHTGGENIGTYTITQGSLLANANYNVAGFSGNNLLITPALLTVVANSQNKVLGTPDPLLTYMTYGLKLNDSAATTLSGALDRDVGDTIGTYSINQGSLTLLSSNYTMTYVAGTFRILAPTVVQEITQTSLLSAPAEDTATTSQEEEKKESAELLAEAAIIEDSGQPLADPLPVCR